MIKSHRKVRIFEKLFLFFLILSGNSHAQLTGDVRKNFIASGFDACYKSQKSSSGNKNVPEITIRKYCGCMAIYTANVLTNQIIKDVESGKQDGSVFNKISALSGKYCAIHYSEY